MTVYVANLNPRIAADNFSLHHRAWAGTSLTQLPWELETLLTVLRLHMSAWLQAVG